MSRRMNTSDPFWWTFFGAGGALSAMFLPVLVVLFGIAIPLGWLEMQSYEKLFAIFNSVVGKLVVFALVSTSMFHWAHRFRFTLYDGLQLKRFEVWIMLFCYGMSIAITLFMGYILWNFGA